MSHLIVRACLVLCITLSPVGLFGQSTLVEIASRYQEGTPREEIHKNDNLQIVKYVLKSKEGRILIEIPYLNGKIHGILKRASPFQLDLDEINYVNGLINDENVAYRLIQTELGGEYDITALQILEWEVDSIVAGKFNGHVKCGLYQINDEDSINRVIKGLKYLPQEFIPDYYLIMKESNIDYYKIEDFNNCLFIDGRLTGRVEFSNGLLNFNSNGVIDGLIRKNSNGITIDSIFRKNQYSLLNEKFCRTNEAGIGLHWSLFNWDGNLVLDYERRDIHFGSYSDTVYQGYFKRMAYPESRIDVMDGTLLKGIERFEGYRLKTWNGVRQYYPGLTSLITRLPYSNRLIPGRITSEGQIPTTYSHSNNVNYEDNDFYTDLSGSFHYGPLDNSSVNRIYFTEAEISTCPPCESMHIGSYPPEFCKLVCVLNLKLPIKYEDLFKAYFNNQKQNGYFISEVHFLDGRSYLTSFIHD